MRLHWLPDVLRAAGLTVHEQSGWRTRGSDTFDPYGLIAHATAGKLSIESDIRVLLNGSTTAPPPISQLFLARTGEWWVIASGRCNHALTGKAGLLKGYGNTRLIGIEAANDNRGEPWPTVQYESYVTGVAAICKHLGWDPSKRVSGHKEHQPGDKSDPTFAMGAFRTHVIQRLARPTTTPQGEDEMIKVLAIAQSNGVTAFYGWAYGHGLVDIPNGSELENWRGAARFAAGGLEVAGDEAGLDQLKWVLDKIAPTAPPAATVDLTPEALAAVGPHIEAAVARALERVRVEVPPAV